MMNQGGINLLLVEDDNADARTIRRLLKEAQGAAFEVECFERLAPALKRLSQGGIDAVLLDLGLPDSRGLETLAKVRSKAPELPIVIITGLDDEDLAIAALQQGAQDYLVKGQIDGRMLSRSVRYAIERRQFDAVLRQTETKYKTLLESAPDAIALVGLDGRVSSSNPAIDQLFGYVSGEVEGRLFQDLGVLRAEDMSKAEEYFRRLLSGDRLEDFELEIRHKDGTYRWASIRCSIISSDHKVTGIMVICRDITRHKEAEKTLREAERRYRAIVENPLNMVFVHDDKGAFIDANETLLKRFGYSSDDKGLNFQALADPDDVQQIRQAISEGMVQGYMSKPIRVRAFTKSKEAVWLEVYGFRLSQEGEPYRGLGIARDITESKLAEEALQASEDRLRDTIKRLELSQAALSTPVIQVWDGVLALPLIGVVDDYRAQQVMEALLRRIVATQSELIILDVTGVASIDTQVANHLIQTTRSVSLLGAQCVLTGIKPEVAQTVIELGLDMSKVVVKRDMQEGLKWALQALDHGDGNGHKMGSVLKKAAIG